jgi:hypothetical protein
VLATDRNGTIRSANAAAAAFLHLRQGRMIGKPALSFVALDDRRELRTALSRAGAGTAPVRTTVAVALREEDPVLVEVTLLSSHPGVVTWLLLSPTVGTDMLLRSLPETLAALSVLPVTSPDLTGALEAAATVIAGSLPEGVAVSIAAGPPIEPRAVGSSAVLAQRIDGAQMMAGTGPCQTAFETQTLVESVDLTVDDRWPALAERVPERVGAIAIPLTVGGLPFGCLNVYCPPEALATPMVEACELFADTVAAVVHDFDSRAELSSLAANLQQAMASRAVIEQAKGIVMASRQCGPEEAFAFLVDVSSTQHVKLREVARRIVENLVPHDLGGTRVED